MRSIFALIVALLVACSVTVQTAKILAIFAFPGPSQYILVQPYLKALAARGHEVTVINAFPQKKPIKNFRDVAVTEVLKIFEDAAQELLVERYKWQELNFFDEIMTKFAHIVFNNTNVQNLLQSNEKFDLIIEEVLLNDALYALSAHYNAPIMGISSYGTDANIDELIGNVSPVSYCPLVTSNLGNRMNFKERLQNLYLNSLEFIHQHLVHIPAQEQIMQKYLPHIKQNIRDLRKRFAIILLNQHFSLSFARPYVPAMIEVGGFHIHHKPAPLPDDMAAFINSSTNGVIYFSMGSNIKSKDFPPQTLNVLLQIFGSLKQKVLWKFETDLPNKPGNVYINSWFPQPDVLAHPNVKLFITHAGLLSTIEAIYHAKPVVGLPMFYDQFLNAERVKQAGFGRIANAFDIREETLKVAIEDVLTNPKYTANAQRMSELYHDQPMKPLDKAIWWTEYVLRHKGAPQLRVAALDLNFIQYHSIDTILVLYGGLAVALWLVGFLIYKVICLALRDTTKTSQEKKKQH